MNEPLRAPEVIGAMAGFGRHRLDVLGPGRIFVLAVVAGGFISFGALLSVLVATPSSALRVARFLVVAWAGNFVGALTVATLVAFSQQYPPATIELLGQLVDQKMAYRAQGDPLAWLQVVSSGMLANWLVGMAAFFAFMARTIIGKHVPVALAVTVFVAANFQHSPANMAYFSLLMAQTGEPGWGPALWWNIVPRGSGT